MVVNFDNSNLRFFPPFQKCPVVCASPNDTITSIIIAPGPDGSIDRWQIHSTWLKGDDKLWKNPADNKYYVTAGPNRKAETSILPHDTICTQNFDITPSMNTLNEIYNKIAVSAVSMAIQNLYVNFDILKDDNILEAVEQQSLHNLRMTGGSLLDGFTEVYLAKDLGIIDGFTIAGKATNFGTNTISLDVINAQTSTLSHEVGHGKYSLRHPEDQFGKPVPADRYKANFMHYTSTGRVSIIRRYQFGLIHKIP